jgi:hypothetical protein
MTTAQRSSRSKTLASLTAAIALLACTQASAHRRDEYLQAARIAIAPARVDIELDLTPGIALASNVVGEIDRDHDGNVAASEAVAYAARVLGEIRLEVDGRPMPLELVEQRFPTVSAMSKGEGTIQIRLAVAVPPLAAGGHRVLYRNDHRPDIAVYLANALVPASDRVAVQAQRRSVDQRDIVIEYALDAGTATGWSWWLAACLGGVTAIVAALGLRRSGTTRSSVPA